MKNIRKCADIQLLVATLPTNRQDKKDGHNY